VYVLPHDWASTTQVLAPLVDRIDETAPDTQLVIVTADAESAAASGAGITRLLVDRRVEAIAATSSRRASRLLRDRPAHIVSGAPAELLALVQGSTLKLDRARAIVLAWVDEILASGAAESLEALLADVPKDAARVIVAGHVTPEVEAVIERYAWRARRVVPPAGGTSTATDSLPGAIEYVTVSTESRLAAVRRILDDADPPRAHVYVRSEDGENAVGELLRTLGYGTNQAVTVGRTAPSSTMDLVVLFDVPASYDELREVSGERPGRIVILVQPRQLASMRALLHGVSFVPLTLPEAAIRARSREALLRAQLRDVLAAGSFGRELLTVEPLLEDYDGVEIAAAALHLLERARAEREAARARADAQAPAAPASMTRLFVNVGSMDGAAARDIVGALTREAQLTGAQVGKVDIRENHSIVEVASDVAEKAVTRLTGSTIRGRRVVARLDQERPGRGERGGPPRGRPAGPRGPAGRSGGGGPRGSGDHRGRGGARGGGRGGHREARERE
jgi:ATP-dependent RNA helicase DeaD